ncbi:hypothetical protein Srut_14170 [Streptomyces rutgersensis]|nr:hypothetical protein Srut_14170 [Streptomyces rutgersensis]
MQTHRAPGLAQQGAVVRQRGADLGGECVADSLFAAPAKGFDPELVRRSYERYAARMGAGTDSRISATGLLSSTANGPVSRSALLWAASMPGDSP